MVDTAAPRTSAAATHPLDALSADELAAVTRAVLASGRCGVCEGVR
jgi:hypothetical protein